MLKKSVIFFIRVYQKTLSPLVGRHCRFHPSCSQYMVDAITKKGLLKGIPMGLWRILRCNPFCKGGSDPVE